ncbi:hypothetical protein CRG98_026824 [Punica granatum]|uniref:Uncharacterized protein n=1 Tax=Punica granatum TaxID=22663 RepID=A0A2I0J982_PUNGR|nr:hypothetical protein CRG98_026824 [Punica granatum]
MGAGGPCRLRPQGSPATSRKIFFWRKSGVGGFVASHHPPLQGCGILILGVGASPAATTHSSEVAGAFCGSRWPRRRGWRQPERPLPRESASLSIKKKIEWGSRELCWRAPLQAESSKIIEATGGRGLVAVESLLSLL